MYFHAATDRKAQNLTRRMAEVEKTALILMGKSYDVIEESWLSLGDTSSLFLAGAKLPGEVIRSMEDLQSRRNFKNTMHKHVPL